MQVICNANMEFVSANTKWPGSTHDSFMLQASTVSDRLEMGEFGDSWILGDSAYPLKKWLMTPLDTPSTANER